MKIDINYMKKIGINYMEKNYNFLKTFFKSNSL